MILRILVWSTLIMIGSGQLDTHARADDASPDRPTSPYTWEMFIGVTAENLGLHVTVETAWPDPEGLDGSVNFWHEAHREYANADAFLAFLKQSKKLAALSFEKDKRQPDVIHVVDRRLIGLRGYALDKKLNLEFAGDVRQLCWTLQRRIGNLAPASGGSGSAELGWSDFATEICLSEKDRQVRGLLTDAVAVKCYNWSLWKATTDLNERHMPTTVVYHGLNAFHLRPIQPHNSPWYIPLLERAGERLGCRFTVETVFRTPNDPHGCPPSVDKDEDDQNFASDPRDQRDAILRALVSKDEEKETFKSVDAFLEKFSKLIPWMVAVKDAKHPKIVHLVDKKLLKLKDYPLDRRLSIEYAGSPHGLVMAVAKRVDSVGPLWFGEKFTPYGGEDYPRIEVRDKKETLRKVLTDAVPSQTACQVVWHARTWLRKNGPETTIEYHPLYPPEKHPGNTDPKKQPE